jgi:hypothetical protein
MVNSKKKHHGFINADCGDYASAIMQVSYFNFIDVSNY